MAFYDHRDLLAADVCVAVVVVSPNFNHTDIMRTFSLTKTGT